MKAEKVFTKNNVSSVFSVYFHSVLLKVAEVKQCVLELQFRKVDLMVEGEKAGNFGKCLGFM